jgi:Bacterial Ig-like domain (group 2)
MFQLAFASFLAVVLCGQSAEAPTHARVRIQPSEVTVRVGESMQFSATVIGASSGIRWSVEEKNGGTVDSNGFYTAPKGSGVFHVIAASEADPRVTTSAKVTVAIEADTGPTQ